MIGRFEEQPSGTRVFVRMRLHDYTLAMMLLIFVIMVYLVVGLVKTDLLLAFGFLALVLVALYLMTIFGFSYEAEEARKMLLDILEGRQR